MLIAVEAIRVVDTSCRLVDFEYYGKGKQVKNTIHNQHQWNCWRLLSALSKYQ
jgi:hypothetical protein